MTHRRTRMHNENYSLEKSGNRIILQLTKVNWQCNYQHLQFLDKGTVQRHNRKRERHNFRRERFSCRRERNNVVTVDARVYHLVPNDESKMAVKGLRSWMREIAKEVGYCMVGCVAFGATGKASRVVVGLEPWATAVAKLGNCNPIGTKQQLFGWVYWERESGTPCRRERHKGWKEKSEESGCKKEEIQRFKYLLQAYLVNGRGNSTR